MIRTVTLLLCLVSVQANAVTWNVAPTSGGFDAGHTLYAKAASPVNAWLRKVTPELSFQCDKKGVRLWLDVGTSLTYTGTYRQGRVRLRIDGGTPVSETWTESSSHGVYGSPNSAARLAKFVPAKLVELEITPHNAGPVTVTFDMSDFAKAASEFDASCKRKP
jgi:hypothetical protein